MRLAAPFLLLIVGACSSTLGNYETRVHVVQPGDTLYTIAWRYNVDFRSLVRWNNLTNPDLIIVGQRIRLTPPSATAAPPTRTAQTPGDRRASVPPARSPPAPPEAAAPRWQWPTRGPVVSAYGDRSGIASGIGIGGTLGQPITAAAGGRVVYAGGGLIGYGQLVIIKHNDTYLSAYGHNSRLLVVQGQEVSRGEKIAEMGLGPQRQPRLHFEIRRNGVPVDPLLFLGSAG